MRSSVSLLLIALLLTGCDQVSGGFGLFAPKLGNLSPTSFTITLNVNQSETRSFSFQNTGNADLTFSISESAEALELVGTTSGTLAPQDRFEGSLSITCLAVGDSTLTVSISSNDVNLDVTVTLSCQSSGAQLGDISPNPLRLSTIVASSVSDTVEVASVGGADLTINLSDIPDWLNINPLSATIPAGTSQTLNVSASCPAEITNLEADINIASNDPDTPSQSFTVSLECLARDFTLSIIRAGSGAGIVSSTAAGISCDESCSSTVTAGSLITLTASPAPDSIFSGFAGACEGQVCDLLMDSDKTVTATFEATAPDISQLDPNPLLLATVINDTISAKVSFQNLGLAVLDVNIEEDADWLDIVPLTASIDGGEGQELTLTASCPSTAIQEATDVAINSNDPDEPVVILEVQLDCRSRQFSLNLIKEGEGQGTVGSTPAGIACSESCVATFAQNTSVRLTATADDGSVFAGFSGDCQGSNSCSVTMTSDKTVTARFDLSVPEPDISAVTPNPLQLSTLVSNTVDDSVSFRNQGEAPLTFSISNLPSWLSLSPTSGSVSPNRRQQLNFTARCPGNPGTLQESITINSNDPDEATISFVVQLDCTPRQFDLTIVKTGLGNGTVTSTPSAINCGANCIASFNEGSSVSLAAQPAAGSVLAGFSGASCQGSSCSLTMNSNQTISVRFDRADSEPDISDPNPNPVQASTSINSSISRQVSFQNQGDAQLTFSISNLPSWLSISPTSGGVSPGSSQQLNLVARCPDNPGTLQETITIDSNDPDEVSKSFVVQLNCTEAQFNLIVGKAGSGSGTVTSTPAAISCGNSCDARFAQGDTVTLSASADPGSEFSGFSGACQGSSCNLTMSSNRSVTATFNTINGGNFDIDLRFVDGNLSASQQAIFGQAASRWEAIITGDLSDQVFTIPAAACSGFDFSGTIDDLVIDVKASTFDGVGGLLGLAGPCALRGNLLPLFGVMEFDQADLAALEANGQLESVILHEMGHVLGIGTLWEPGFFNLLSFNGSDCLSSSVIGFTGLRSNQEFVILGGSGTVPVENDGGAGTKCGHWDEQSLGTELMTGFLNGGVPNPLSRLTIASLEDISYDVNYATADPFVLSSISPSVLTEQLNYQEILIKPTIILPESSE